MLGLSTRTTYAVAAMLTLIQRGSERPVPIKEIAKEANVPRNFLEQILLELKKAGILTSTKGAYGGYALARPAEEITLKEIVTILEDGYFETACKTGNPALALFWEEFLERMMPLWETPLGDLPLYQQKVTQSFNYSI